MGARSVRRSVTALSAAGLISLICALPAAAAARKVTVCPHGCRYSTIQSGVNATGKNGYVYVKPGRYVEGVMVSGHRHDGLHIIGLGKTPQAVLIEGKNAHNANGLAQNGVEGDGVNNLDLENLKAEHFAANGFFINGCKGYTMRKLVGAFEHSYGLYVFKCIGGRMTQSVGYGNGDSAFYIGGTPFQSKPVWSSVDHSTGYGNVLGYSGTNSKYVTITNDDFYDNGVGIVPNTESGEPFMPTEDGVIEHNLIYWNNFDYYRAHSPVRTVSSGVHGQGSGTNYPVGVGIAMFGSTGWTIEHNQIFGNFLWGAAAFSDPTNSSGKAINVENHFIDNTMGAAMNDTNGYDFFNDGSGHGTCFQNNGTVTENPGTASDAVIYPACPTTNGTNSTTGDGAELKDLVEVVAQTTGQEQYWKPHSHPARSGRTAYTGPPAKYPKGAGQ